MNFFPPPPAYPTGYDSDYTLFQVFDTAESFTTQDTPALSDEVSVRPRRSDQSEIWASNGWANISGELFYYDAVGLNSSGRVCRLRRCSRGIAGRHSQFNPVGTSVRGFVVAEHHNQMAEATILAESFIGENYSTDPATLDWRIRHLADSPALADDLCPDVDFLYQVVSDSPVTGTVIRYDINLRGRASFKLDFGDGKSTTSETSGTHIYSPGANISPTLVMVDGGCQLVMSPTDLPLPPSTETPPFTVSIPTPPDIPVTIIPKMVVGGPTINIPPLVLPSIVSMPSAPRIPSTIVVSPAIPPKIVIESTKIPSRILGPNIQIPSQVTIENVPRLTFGPPPPIPAIQIQPPMIPPIQIAPLRSDIPSVIRIEAPSLRGIEAALSGIAFPSVVNVRLISDDRPGGNGGHMSGISLIAGIRSESVPKFEMDVDSIRSAFAHAGREFRREAKIEVPAIKMDWGEVPTLRAVLKLETPGRRQNNLLAGVEDIHSESVPFNGEFKLLPPDIPDIKVVHDVPRTISVQSDIRDIKLVGADRIPTQIELLPPKEGLSVSVVPFTLPELKLNIDTEKLEKVSIGLKIPELPTLKVEFPEKIPKLQVEFPSKMPKIEVTVPDSARVPLVYTGPPIPIEPVKINFVMSGDDDVDDGTPCVRIVACPRR